jgi:hypothetical protein
MARIFISYASADREKAKALAAFLKRRSHSVFWDRTIPPGRTFCDVIETALKEAEAVIVLWSAAAVTSSWVRVEAEEAAARDVLLPVMIESVTPPLRFKHIQAADLSGWDFKSHCHAIAQVLKSADDLARMPPPRSVPHSEPPNPSAGDKFSGPVLWKALGFHLLLGCGLFYVDRQRGRWWVYCAASVYAIVDAMLGRVYGLRPFAGGFGFYTFAAAMTLYLLSFVDVVMLCQARRPT